MYNDISISCVPVCASMLTMIHIRFYFFECKLYNIYKQKPLLSPSGNSILVSNIDDVENQR